jgi:prolyl oligopeptidase
MRFGKIWAMAAVTTLNISASAVAQDADPFLWLEEFTSPRVMEWVEAHNAKTLARLEGDPRFATFNAQALEIAQASDRIPSGRFLGGEIYNFWQDANHVRGILRKTSLADYATSAPRWTTVLDLDALARREGANWVYKGMDCARPAETRCLISLSDGGEDAVTIREFDLLKRRFVAGGFVLPKGKQRVTWESENSLLVSREWRRGELGRTGYPFIVKRVTRGRPLSAARELYRGRLDDGGYGVTPTVLRDAQGRTIALIKRPLDTFRSETHVVTPAGVKLLGVPAKSGCHRADRTDGW